MNSNNVIRLFENKQFGSVRAIESDGKVLFCGKDVATALGYKDATNAIKQHCRGVAFHHPIVDSLGRTQEARFISEPDVIRLIVSSKLPKAQEFEKWVFEEVIPSVLKHGGYINPNASEHQINALILQARSRMELCQAAKGLIHPDHLEAKARIILAQGMGEHAQLEPSRAPLYVQSFLREKNLSTSRLRKISGTFGKRVKAAYVLEHGTDPEKYPLEIKNGQIKNVYAYTEGDRGLMQQVWENHYETNSKEVA